MNPLLIVIPFTTETAPMAERLCDWIFQLNRREQAGHALLVAGHDVHKELCVKTAIAAEVAFETSELIVSPETSSPTPAVLANQMFKFAGDYVTRHFRCPWLWLETQCVPLKPDWMAHLAMAYYSQPKRFMGSHLRISAATDKSPEKLCLARCSIYPADAINDLSPYCASNGPFQISAADHVLSRSTRSRLIQELAYDGDPSKLRPGACVLNGDKSGKLIEYLADNLPKEESFTIPVNNGTPKLTVDERMAKARAARKRVGTVEIARL